MRRYLVVVCYCAAVAVVARDVWERRETWKAADRCAVGSDGKLVHREAGHAGRVYLDADAYYWLYIARQVYSGNVVRVRSLPFDNAPFGRESHWSSLLPLLISAGAHTAGVLTGGDGAEMAAAVGSWINPLLLLLMGLSVALMFRGRLPPLLLGALVVATVTLPALRKDAAWSRIDHHALVDLAACLAVGLGGIAAVTGDGGVGTSSGRRRFAAAGIAGGILMWLEAAAAVPLLGAMALANIVLRGMGRNGRASAMMWREWARWGAGTSVVLYIWEYLPGHAGMVLEVNHPVYALAWLGAGELAVVIARGNPAGRARRVAVGMFWGACIGLPALLIFRGPQEWFVLRDPFLIRVHQCIAEFQPFFRVFHSAPLLGFAYMFGVLPLLPAWGILHATERGLAAGRRSGLLATSLAAGAALTAALGCSRFAGLFSAALVPAAGLVLVELFGGEGAVGSRRVWLARGMAAVLLVQAALMMWPEARALGRIARGSGTEGCVRLPPRVVSQILLRDTALETAGLVGESGAVALVGLDLAAYCQFFAPLRSTGALYWENRDGLRATAEFFCDYGDHRARRIARERNVALVIVEAAPEAAARWHYCLYGYADPQSVRRTLGYRLAVGEDVPAWLCRIGGERVRLTERAGFRVYRVRDVSGG